MSFFWPIAAGATLFSLLSGGKDEGEQAQSELTEVQKELAQLMLQQYKSRFANEEAYMPEALKTTFDYTKNTLNRGRNVVWGKGIFEPTLQARPKYDIKTPDWKQFEFKPPGDLVPPGVVKDPDPVTPPPDPPGPLLPVPYPGPGPGDSGIGVIGGPDGPLPPQADPGIPPTGPPFGFEPPGGNPFNPGMFDSFFKYADLMGRPTSPTDPPADLTPPWTPPDFIRRGEGGGNPNTIADFTPPFTNPFLNRGPEGNGLANVGMEQFPFVNPLLDRDMGNGIDNVGQEVAPPFSSPFLNRGPEGNGIANVGREQFPFTNPFGTQGPGGEGLANVGMEQFPFVNPLLDRDMGNGIDNVGQEVAPPFSSPFLNRGPEGNGIANVGREQFPFTNPFGTQGPGGEGLANVGREQFPWTSPLANRDMGNGIANIGAETGIKVPTLSPLDAARLYGKQGQDMTPPVTATPPGASDPLTSAIIFYHGQGKSLAEINRLTGVSIPEIASTLGLPSMPSSNTPVRGNILGG